VLSPHGICSDLFPSFSSLLDVFQYLAGVLGYPVRLYHLTPLITSHYFVAVLETPGDILRIYCSVGNIHLAQFVSNFHEFVLDIKNMCISHLQAIYNELDFYCKEVFHVLNKKKNQNLDLK
jgi:hypothetical protein